MHEPKKNATPIVPRRCRSRTDRIVDTAIDQFDPLSRIRLESRRMALSPDSHLQHDSVGTWLRRLALGAAIVLLASCSWFVWRISMVAYQMEGAIVAISADVKQMSSTGAQISDHLQKLDGRLRAIEEKAADAMNIDEFEHLLDEVDEIREGTAADRGPASLQTDREIRHLLAQIRGSDYRFTYSVLGSDKSKCGTVLYLQLYTKYKTYKNVISSAEDFIDKVATTTIGGQPYQVVVGPDETVALNDWLTEALKKYRATARSTHNVE